MDDTPNLDDYFLPKSGELIHTLEAVAALNPGDHLIIRLTQLPFGFHHGIYLGESRVGDLNPILEQQENLFNTLINTVNGNVQSRTLIEFLGDQNYIIRINYDDEDSSRRTLALQRINQFIDSPDNPPYNLLFSNCDCLASFCWTGRYDKYYDIYNLYLKPIFIKSNIFL
jgi:hypothetical protein